MPAVGSTAMPRWRIGVIGDHRHVLRTRRVNPDVWGGGRLMWVVVVVPLLLMTGTWARMFATQMSPNVVDTQYGRIRGVLVSLPNKNLGQVRSDDKNLGQVGNDDKNLGQVRTDYKYLGQVRSDDENLGQVRNYEQ